MVVTSSKPKPRKSLAETHPEIASQAVGWDPKDMSAGSSKKLRWRCENGHEYLTTPTERTSLKRGCAICKNQKVLAAYNDLATTHPELALQAVGWDPTTVIAGSRKKLQWQCDKGHVYKAVLYERSIGTGCPYCSNNKVLAGYNDLATTHPELAFQAVGWDPTTVIAGSHQSLLWRCENGHEFQTLVNTRAERSIGCHYCSNKKVLAGYNDLATTHPELALQAVGWDPNAINAGSHKKVKWRCENGHHFTSQVASRAKRNLGCAYCSNKKVLKGFNDLATTHPELAAQAYQWDPATLTCFSNKQRMFICSEGHTWRSVVANRTKGSACPMCSVSGFVPSLDGWLYFLDHDEWQMFQIGITNYPNERLSDHKKLGWTVLEIRGAMDGAATRDLETAILRSLKRRGAVFANKADGQKFDGWSEAWLKSSVTVSGLKELMDFVHEDESLI